MVWCIIAMQKPLSLPLVTPFPLNCIVQPVITQPPYSLDLTPSDFWLFPTLKMGLKGMHFATMEDIKSNATAKLQRFQKKPSASASNNGRIDGASVCVCVCVQGSNFEGD
jgi:hypothetical protein